MGVFSTLALTRPGISVVVRLRKMVYRASYESENEEKCSLFMLLLLFVFVCVCFVLFLFCLCGFFILFYFLHF